MPAWCCWVAETIYFTIPPLIFVCLLWLNRLHCAIVKLLVCFKCTFQFCCGDHDGPDGNWGWDLIYHMKRERRVDDKMMPDARFVVKVKKKKRPFGNNLDLDRFLRENRTTRMKTKALATSPQCNDSVNIYLFINFYFILRLCCQTDCNNFIAFHWFMLDRSLYEQTPPSHHHLKRANLLHHD